MPPSASAAYEVWGHVLMPEDVEVDVLLPYGAIMITQFKRDATLRYVKDFTWREMKNGLFHKLVKSQSDYVFVIVTLSGDREEIYDETRRLCDLHLFQLVLRLVECCGDREANMLESTIGIVIGKSLSEFNETNDPEMIHARLHFLDVCESVVEEMQRKNLNNDGKEFGKLPCDSIENVKATSGTKDIPIHFILYGNQEKSAYITAVLKVDPNSRPSTVIKHILEKKQFKSARISGANYIIKIRDSERYFCKEVEICKYAYIQQCLRKNEDIWLEFVDLSQNRWRFIAPNFKRRHCLPVKTHKYPQSAPRSLWDIDKNFSVNILSASYINLVDKDDFVFVRVGVFRGTELIDEKDTKDVSCLNPRWNANLEFNIYMKDIPSCAQICFAICSIKRKQKKNSATILPVPLGWANLRLTDFTGRFITELVSLHLWPYPKGFEGILNPLGHKTSNPQRDVPCLEVRFKNFDADLYLPTKQHYDENLKFLNSPSGARLLQPAVKENEISQRDRQVFDEILHRDALHEMTEQEKATMWRLRHFCKNRPNSLPRLLDAVNWKKRENHSQIYALLDEWPVDDLDSTTCLELLDIKYLDRVVRKFAVKCLDMRLSNEELYTYMIYLVQVLKYEPFSENDLSKFLLKRALQNQRLGHVFFWLLRAEIDHDNCWPGFGLLLEAYCRGCGPYLKSLERQIKAMEMLIKLSFLCKEKKDETVKLLSERLESREAKDVLQTFENPLDSSIMLGDLIVDQCRVINSAKRPLWLSWKNNKFSNACYEILFKNGDDLRQDMLILQVLQLMEDIWLREGKNFYLTPYKCLPMGKHVGMIEVVQRSKTILEIQNQQGKMGALNVGFASLLHKWIREHANDYDEAIQRFTMSCAGYCVATFVLGIRDRHSSNIMICDDGRIFHIDFGHFLGHYKKKFGVNRERVPFVLTDDFLHVIAKGADNPRKTKEYSEFQKTCVQAYLILHKHARLFVTLFTMMLCMNIPELQKLEDIHYLRTTLAVDLDDDDAADYFRDRLNAAHHGGWTTKVDWFFHSVRHM